MSFRIIHVKSKPYVLTSEVSKTFAAFLRLIMPPFRAEVLRKSWTNLLCKIRTQRKDTLDIVIRSDAMNDAENDSGKQHVLHQFGREENGLEFLFLLDGIPVDATRWRADMIFVLDVNFHVLLLTWNLCLSCV